MQTRQKPEPNRKLSDYCRSSATPYDPSEEGRLLRVMSYEDRQIYHLLKFEIDRLASELESTSGTYRSYRESLIRDIRLKRGELAALKGRYDS